MISLAFALAVATSPQPSAQDARDQLERAYQQSCAERAYGSYNDLCDQMRREIRAYKRAAAAERRGTNRTAAPPASPPPGAVRSTPEAVHLEPPAPPR